MARIRYIKPGFFLDDELAEVQPLGRILFAALWCVADREGRLEDRPRRIKTEALPYDDVDVNTLLDELATAGFITRYESGGRRYIAVSNFSRHQVPFNKEPASVIPEPPSLPLASAKLGPSYFEGTGTEKGTYIPSSDDDDVMSLAVDNSVNAMSFDAFWTSYPRKTHRPDALKAWGKLTKTDQRLALSGASGIATAVRDGTRPKDKTPYPATFLNSGEFAEWANGKRADGYEPPKRDGDAHFGPTEYQTCSQCGKRMPDCECDEFKPKGSP